MRRSILRSYHHLNEKFLAIATLPTYKQEAQIVGPPEEILSTLSKYVQELPPAHLNDEDGRMTPSSLKELSCTCKKMRRITNPDLFRLVNIDRLVFTIGLLPSLETIYNMPRDYLYNRANPACISVHPKPNYVEVSPTPMDRWFMDFHYHVGQDSTECINDVQETASHIALDGGYHF